MTEGNKGSLERKLGREGRNVEVFSGFFSLKVVTGRLQRSVGLLGKRRRT